MADLLDDADNASAAFFRAALTTKKPEGPAPNGFCFACGTVLTNGQRFCDKLCADDFEYEQKRAQS